jgi:hypothetical protein
MAYFTIRMGDQESTVFCKSENVIEIMKSWIRRGWKLVNTN